MTKTVHLDFKDIGYESQWCDLEDPKDYTQSRYEAVLADMLKAKEDPAVAEKFFRDRIASWHLVNGDTDEPLNDPKTDDLKGIKVAISLAIGEKISELFEATVPFRSKRA